jgi:hypothetical protein
MQYVFDTLDNFLNEDKGSLKIFGDIPKEWDQKLFKGSGWSNIAGPESEVQKIEDPTDYKKFLEIIKKENIRAIIVKVDGYSKYFIERISDQKFKVYDADQESSVRNKRRDEERKAQEAERTKLSESRRHYHYYDPAESEMKVPEMINLFKKIEGEGKQIEVFAILKDIKRNAKNLERGKEREKLDPLEKDKNAGYYDRPSPTQKRRYSVYAEKKRVEIDKKIDDELEELKSQIVNNLDKALEKIVDNIRKGYDSYASADNISSELMKGINLKGIQRFAKAYDSVSPNTYSGDGDTIKAAQKLKNLGFLKNESVNEAVNDQGEHEENHIINGSGLFFFNSTVDKKTKLDIIAWYKGLTPIEKEYVDILMREWRLKK